MASSVVDSGVGDTTMPHGQVRPAQLMDQVWYQRLETKRDVGLNNRKSDVHGLEQRTDNGAHCFTISKVAGHVSSENLKEKKNFNQAVSLQFRQRSLAEISEMIHIAHLIHKGVVNLSPIVFDGTLLQDLEYGNKIAILCGDYFLTSAFAGLAALRNVKVMELISTAVRDFTEAEFIGVRDDQGNQIPDATMTMLEWEKKNFLAAGSLLAKSIRQTIIWAGHRDELQPNESELGNQIAFAWQAYSDLQPFTDLYCYPPGTTIDLTSAPVILHLQSDPSLLRLISAAGDSMEHRDFKKIHHVVMAGRGVQETKDLCKSYIQAALNVLQDVFEPSDARTALENIIKVTAFVGN
nr:LOW QUALITY PROTEIN: all trans-polyprenyl-diphosphate synthase PDSS2-like [Cherax quadricarinatus]